MIHIIIVSFPMEIIRILGWLIVWFIIVSGKDVEFHSVYLDARCLATCSTEVFMQ